MASNSNTELPPDVGHRVALVAVWWSLFSVATVVVTLRFWARKAKQNLGWDDFFMAFCYILFLTEAILITYVAENGGTQHLVYLGTIPRIERTIMFYIIILDVGIFVTGVGKIAIGVTILRIFGRASLWQRWAVWFVMALTIITSFIDFGVSTFLCGNPTLTWTLVRPPTAHCISEKNQTNINLFSNVVQVFADFSFSILPMAVVWGLRMPMRRKLIIMGALGLTLFTGAAGTVKTVLAATFNESDLTYTIYPNLVWFAIEATLIVVCGSVPTLQPLYERYIWRRRRGYLDQDDSKTYVNSGGSASFSRKSGRRTQASRTNPDSSLRSLNAFETPTGQEDPASLEMRKLDGYPPQPPTLAEAVMSDNEALHPGQIQVTKVVDIK
ncbi:hypothetical protein F5Y16DRAFT_154600 [Xylariaceae sp. FL0255]|nr:hypothetical protein F5Y16DRAFT_154600 [Xylariaceae sp. FL0255]